MTAPAALPSLPELAAAIARREHSSLELVEACLDRIAAREEDVQAWAVVDADGARAQARALDAEAPRGPLHGIPVGIKDIIDTAGLPTERGTPIHAGRVPDADAACVARLRAAGAVVLGKTVTTELATWAPSATRNPWALDRTPGGSSSGSAAAVADGMVPVALGTQTVGSTIRPAAFCGVAALKPTHDAASLAGVLVHSAHLDTLGVMAADPDGVLQAWRAIADPDGQAASPAPHGGRGGGGPAEARVGLAWTPWSDRLDDGSRAAMEDAARALRGRGAEVAGVDLPAEFGDLPAAHLLVTEHAVARSLAAHAEDPRLTPALRAMVQRGLELTDAARDEALEVGRRVGQEVDRLWQDCDALLVPAVTGEAPSLAEGTTGDAIYCQPWSLLGHPAATVPGGRGPAGLPVGVQLVGPHGRDVDLLEVAALAVR